MMNQDGLTVLSDPSLALVEELRAIREAVKSLKARENDIRDRLLEDLKGVDVGLTAAGTPAVEVQRYSRTKVDSNRLQALYKDVWDDCQIETVVQVIRIPETE